MASGTITICLVENLDQCIVVDRKKFIEKAFDYVSANVRKSIFGCYQTVIKNFYEMVLFASVS